MTSSQKLFPAARIDSEVSLLPSRRLILGAFGTGIVGAALSSAAVGEAEAAAPPSVLAPPADPGLVRISAVVVPQEDGLLDALLPEFTRQSGFRVNVVTGPGVVDPARGGRADLVIAHYGHADVRSFMEDGLGEWPQAVFFNQLALIGPASDPARVRGEPDMVAAMQRIVASRSPYIVNDIDGIKYLSEILLEAAGRPPRNGWYVDMSAFGPAAVALAATRQGYTIWGLTPFLRTQRGAPNGLVPVFVKDPLLQRIMVTIAVRAEKVRGINTAGARALQKYLVTPKVQAAIRSFRAPGIDDQVWWPAGRNNAGDVLQIGNG